MSKLNQYPTDDTAADANIFNFWKTASGAVKKTTWGNLITLIRTALSNASGTVKGVVKLYNNVTGNNTDGAPDQASVKAAIAAIAHFKGLFANLGALQAAYPTATAGDYATVDPGGGTDAQNYLWDAQEGWVTTGSGGGVTTFNGRVGTVLPSNGDYTTDQITEANDKLYTSAAEKQQINVSVPNTRTVNGQQLVGDIVINAIEITGMGLDEVTPDTWFSFVNAGVIYRFAAQNMGDA